MNPTDDRFLQAALAEDGMPIAAGYVPEPPNISADANERFQIAARAEGGVPISAGVTTAEKSLDRDAGSLPDR